MAHITNPYAITTLEEVINQNPDLFLSVDEFKSIGNYTSDNNILKKVQYADVSNCVLSLQFSQTDNIDVTEYTQSLCTKLINQDGIYSIKINSLDDIININIILIYYGKNLFNIDYYLDLMNEKNTKLNKLKLYYTMNQNLSDAPYNDLIMETIYLIRLGRILHSKNKFSGITIIDYAKEFISTYITNGKNPAKLIEVKILNPNYIEGNNGSEQDPQQQDPQQQDPQQQDPQQQDSIYLYPHDNRNRRFHRYPQLHNPHQLELQNPKYLIEKVYIKSNIYIEEVKKYIAEVNGYIAEVNGYIKN